MDHMKTTENSHKTDLPTKKLHIFLKIQRQFYHTNPQYKTTKGENGLFNCDLILKRIVMVKSGEKTIEISRIATTKKAATQFAAMDVHSK